jgi:hypothetical protein
VSQAQTTIENHRDNKNGKHRQTILVIMAVMMLPWFGV